MPEQTCLIVPCYNEATRLDIARFKAAVDWPGLWIVFVDDGSTDGTAELIQQHTNDRIRLIRLERNSGKAQAVREGMLKAAELPFYKRLNWIGFWDADLSTPLTELPRFIAFQELTGVRADAVFGSRVARLGSRIERRLVRHLFGRLFATAASNLLGVKAYDSQCGAKIFRPDVASRCFADPFITRWLFDLEILMRLPNAVVLEYPVMEWVDVGGSKLKLLPNLWRTARDLMRLRLKYR